MESALRVIRRNGVAFFQACQKGECTRPRDFVMHPPNSQAGARLRHRRARRKSRKNARIQSQGSGLARLSQDSTPWERELVQDLSGKHEFWHAPLLTTASHCTGKYDFKSPPQHIVEAESLGAPYRGRLTLAFILRRNGCSGRYLQHSPRKDPLQALCFCGESYV